MGCNTLTCQVHLTVACDTRLARGCITIARHEHGALLALTNPRLVIGMALGRPVVPDARRISRLNEPQQRRQYVPEEW